MHGRCLHQASATLRFRGAVYPPVLPPRARPPHGCSTFGAEHDTIRHNIQRDLEASIRRREQEHDRALLEHKQAVRRLQKDHAASEVAFRSIVSHLESQLQAAQVEMDRTSDRARNALDNARVEFDSNSEAQATSQHRSSRIPPANPALASAVQYPPAAARARRPILKAGMPKWASLLL